MFDFEADVLNPSRAYLMSDEEADEWLSDEEVCDICGGRLDKFQMCPQCDYDDAREDNQPVEW